MLRAHHRKEALMCTRTDHDGACEDCARTDTWLDLTATREPQTTTMPPMRGDGGEKR